MYLLWNFQPPSLENNVVCKSFLSGPDWRGSWSEAWVGTVHPSGSLYTLPCTVYTVHCTLYIVNCYSTLCCKLCTVNCTLYFKLCTVNCTLYCKLCTVNWTLYCILYTVYCSLHCTPFTVHCTVHCWLFTVYIKLCTVNCTISSSEAYKMSSVVLCSTDLQMWSPPAQAAVHCTALYYTTLHCIEL